MYIYSAIKMKSIVIITYLVMLLLDCVIEVSRWVSSIEFNPQKVTLGIRTSKATWGQMWLHHENYYN
jgi:hypothetical protein